LVGADRRRRHAAEKLKGFNTKDTKEEKARFARWKSSKIVEISWARRALRVLPFLRELRV